MTIEAAGVPLAVTEFPHSGKPAVVLLHGIGSRGQSWWPVIDTFQQHFHLYQVDLRGHGDSGKPENGYSLGEFVVDLEATLQALGLDRPRIVGHSLGAVIALLWANEHPSAAAALVLEDPPLTIRPELLPAFDGWQQLAALTPEAAAAWYRQEYPHWTLEDCERRAQNITSTAPGVFGELRSESEAALRTGATDRTPTLSVVTSPVLLVRGNPELGGMVPLEDVLRLEAVMPHAHVVSIMDAGHGLHRDATEAFLEVVIPFLASAEA
jgi:pimeloyl-ACP methyl ester carboxylesterase